MFTGSLVPVKCKDKVFLVLFYWAPRHEGVLGEWRYILKHSWPWHVLTVLPLTAPRIHCIGGWMGPTAGLDEVLKRKNSCSQWEMNPGCSAHSLVTILTELPWLWPATSWKDKFCASKSYKIWDHSCPPGWGKREKEARPDRSWDLSWSNVQHLVGDERYYKIVCYPVLMDFGKRKSYSSRMKHFGAHVDQEFSSLLGNPVPLHKRDFFWNILYNCLCFCFNIFYVTIYRFLLRSSQRISRVSTLNVELLSSVSCQDMLLQKWARSNGPHGWHHHQMSLLSMLFAQLEFSSTPLDTFPILYW